ncbi:hypothetical protein SAMD00019534_100870 [Acytostelium subglobosum LB1]|uniref:hypothetical protein n=1 Tax=Acytostelium subglobosum LB1 TaxID=1410327 RepID=UPI00064518F0|nr:hypothetical protein SAMD00019534_100870 [Acytostelium subglobosum LB1]GAM26912.1 hypothetical protein SAMD00019534_100870 [Acytostelium subglobosum LB1]|eukprot:XP_012750180.1 hypothetical protein SAMD00019534_100870 [Acytostelium subglobosum LB1]
MGVLLSKGKSFEKELVEIEEKILKYEAQVSNARGVQSRLVRRTIIFGIMLELVLIAWVYLNSRRDQHYQLLHIASLVILPFIVYIFTRAINSTYCYFIGRKERTLVALKAQMIKRINDRKKETDYENTQKLIDKYNALMKRKSSQSSSTTTTSPQPLGNRGSPAHDSNTPVNNRQNNTNTRNNAALIQSPDSSNIRQRHSVSQSSAATIATTAPTSPMRTPGGRGGSKTSSSSEQPTTPTQSPQQQQQQRSFFDKIVDYLINDGPRYGSPIICAKCHSHNGYVPSSELASIQFRCRYCQSFNQRGGTIYELPAAADKSRPSSEVDDKVEVDHPELDNNSFATEASPTKGDVLELNTSASKDVAKVVDKSKPMAKAKKVKA